ncbi:MAG TPA: hypothetical protein VE398_19565 [Acidobacteriota bacterium]|nr:hypothetical protein [Acidobacteriota bacterium]
MRAAAQMRMIGSDYDPRGLAFRKRLREFKTKYVSLWHAPGSNEPEIDERFEPAAQRENEKETDRLIRHVEDRL